MACVDIASWDVPGATDTAFGRPVQPPAAGTLSPVPWGQPHLNWGARVPWGQPGLRWGWVTCCQAREWGLVLGRDRLPARGSEGHPCCSCIPQGLQGDQSRAAFRPLHPCNQSTGTAGAPGPGAECVPEEIRSTRLVALTSCHPPTLGSTRPSRTRNRCSGKCHYSSQTLHSSFRCFSRAS